MAGLGRAYHPIAGLRMEMERFSTIGEIKTYLFLRHLLFFPHINIVLYYFYLRMANMNDSEPVNEAYDDGWTSREHQDIPPIIVDGVLHGAPYRIRLDGTIFQQRRVGVVAGRDGLNDNFFIAANNAPTTPSDFPDVPLAQAGNLYDVANEGRRSRKTVLRASASTIFFDTDAAIEERGGKPDHRIEQPDDSFAYTPGS